MNFFRMDIAFGLALMFTTGSAHAGTPMYSVEARAMTSRTPGSGSTYVGPLVGEVSAHAVNDPPASQWTFNYSHILFSDALAESWADIASLTTHASAVAHRIDATNFPSAPQAQTFAKYGDRIVVTSDTLPVGTPVTVSFGNLMTVDWQGAGLYNGSATCVLQIGGKVSHSTFSVSHTKEAGTVAPEPLVIQTKVGNTISLSSWLTTSATASFWVPGPTVGGEITLDATCDTPVVAVTPGVELVSHSGVDFLAP